ncbi:signal peptide protein [Paenibacillus radicibacter]|uniref:signal peptide protein n=1 Tax=Paenibacillus radicibacter TaxID=2972488 RepID=UPI00358FCD39
MRQKMDPRYKKIFIGLGIAFVVLLAIGLFINPNKSGSGNTNTTSAGAESSTGNETLPWDYKIVEGTVGDLIGADMTILPDNEMLTNDNNYATGDKLWIVQFMSAEMTTRDDKRNDIKLSKWQSIKTYKSKAEAETDLKELKVNLTTDVDLVGVYKTEMDGKFRQFAVVKMPSGHVVKQPIDDARYGKLKDKKQVKVVLEEVHDFANYDLSMAKFRGWAE